MDFFAFDWGRFFVAERGMDFVGSKKAKWQR